MAHLIDIILVALILLILFISSKRGIILTVFDLASGIIAFLFAKLTSPYAAEYIYDGYIRNQILNFLTEKYSGIENSFSDALGSVMSLFNFLPDGILTYAEKSGILDPASIADKVMNSITTVEQIERSIISPVVISVLNIFSFAVISFVGLIVLRIAGRLIARLVTTSKIADKLDTLLGAVFGVLKGAVYVFIIAIIINVISFSSETIAAYAADSYICSFASKIIGI